MNSAVKTSLRILLLIVLVHANVDQLHMKFKQQCQVKKKNVSEKIYLFKGFIDTSM